ncbi:MAG: outer membrane protein assembly factor BamB family protein, partial [Planctomycetota bacterium]
HVPAAEGDPAVPGDAAREILEPAGTQGGLIVHLGCGDGRLTAALRASDSYLVHGLDVDEQNVRKAREHIRSLGLYGSVSVDRFDGSRLPYVDNLVNLVVSEDFGDVPTKEVMRVLAPGGAAYTGQDGRWTRIVKPRPAEIDDWTHYLHDATNNAVADDTVVGPPRHLQWVGSPRWARHHDHMSSFNALVSAGGRVFYIFDEGPTSAIQLPPKWTLIARDAFNGTILWKRRIDRWHEHLWPLKSGPALLPRRLVAVGNTVFVTLGLDAPLTALDAATGKTLRTYEGSTAVGGIGGCHTPPPRTEEIIYSDGVLFLLVDEHPTGRPWSTRPRYGSIAEIAAEPSQWAWDSPPRLVVAVEAETGRVLWRKPQTVVPMTLAADARRVLFHDGTRVVCLDRRSGELLWKSEPIVRAAAIRSWFAPTLVTQDDVVLLAGGEKIVRHRGGQDTMTALDARTGKTLWTAEHPPSGYDSPEDVLVVDGLVWTAPMTNRRDSGRFTGRDLHTGEVKRSFPADDGVHMPHHRCHRAKATASYILASRTGIEYVDVRAEHWDRNDWVRGACLYGIMPANGLTYAPLHSCACYIVAKQNGFNALAPASPTRRLSKPISEDDRLQRGPAYNQDIHHSSLIIHPSDWPTYRHDAARSGRTPQAVPANLKPAWQTELGGKLSAVTIAGGRLFVAAVDRHTVHALNADSGRRQWSFTAGGRVDSPPAIWQGRVLFGSADGRVYCLRASDGRLIWRFRAAPADRRLTAFEQIESVWPVHGSVLLRDGVVHCVAGRSMFLDGGMRLLLLDAKTGRKISETVLDQINPQTGKPLDANITWPNLPVTLPDVLSCDGKYIYMRSQRFDLAGRRPRVVVPTDHRDQTGEGAHLFCPTGFLDDTWWHRTYWIWGKTPRSAAGGWYLAAYAAPAGRIMVCDESRVYAFGRKPQYFPRTTALEYHLFSAAKEPRFVRVGAAKPKQPNTQRRRPAPMRPVYRWSEEMPLLGRALVLAGQTLFVAGPRDVVDT